MRWQRHGASVSAGSWGVLRVGGPLVKAKAIEGLTGTEQQLRDVAVAVEWFYGSPLGAASEADRRAACVYRNMVTERNDALSTANQAAYRR